MSRVPDIIHLQEYPLTVNIPPSHANKFLLQIAINKAKAVGYIFSSNKWSSPSPSSGRIWTQSQKRQQDKASGVHLVAGIHIPPRRARTYVDEENKSQDESDSDYG